MTMHKTAACLASFLVTASLCIAAGYYRELLALPRVAGGAAPATGFITTWVVTNGGSITLPLRAAYTYNMSVDYGDGTVVNVTSNSDPDATHQYASGDSNRTVTITGTMGAWYFNSGGSRANFRGVSLWEPVGGVAASGLEGAFYGCTAATFTNYAIGFGSSWLPVTSLVNTWRGCRGVKDSFPAVNTLTNVTTLSGAWLSCSGNTNTFLDVYALVNVTNLSSAWNTCSGIKNGFPEVSALTNTITLDNTWGTCSGNTNNFPAVSNLTKVTTLFQTWNACSGIQNGFPEVNALTNVSTIAGAWYNCSGNTNRFPTVSNLVKVITLDNAWQGCSGIKNGFPEVNTLTNVTRLLSAWQDCSGNTNAFPAVSNLTKVTTLSSTWQGCSASYFNIQDVLGNCSWITGQVKNVASAFNGNIRMTGNGMPLVTAITNSPGYPTGYTITDCFHDCTNLTDWADIPAAFK
jgi:hypothetical protein